MDAHGASEENDVLIKSLLLTPAHPALSPPISIACHAAASTLHKASRLLHRLAQALTAAPARPAMCALAPLLEFHAEAGAPEGALYVDGQLIAHLSGVTRL